MKADQEVPSADSMKVVTRVLHLPCVLHDKWNREAMDKYAQSNKAANGEHWTRPYLPDNSEFVAKQNGLPSVDAVNDIILKAEGVGKVFPGTIALQEVDFEVRRGAVNVLVGENGAGKSTLMKILAGATEPTTGRLLLRGGASHPD